MFRFRLTVVIIVSFGFVLLLGTALFWGSNQAALYVQRSQTAYEAFERYEQLSQEAYRHFKQRMDRLINTNPSAESGVKSSKHRLYEAMQELRDTAVKAPIAEDSILKGKPSEMERVAQVSAFLDSIEYWFDEAERLLKKGKNEMAAQTLAKFSEEEIDGKFQPLIDAAINEERKKAEKSKQELEILVAHSRLISILVSLAALIFSLSSGILLLRGVKKPIEALMKCTDEISAGNLDYRISLDTQDEFAYLAGHFNQMAQKLETQQYKLRESQAVLENRVAERTFELNRLNEELNSMDTARRELLIDISHELRTPITVIRGEAEVTLRGQERNVEEYKDALQRIVELSMQLAKYVDDLLFLARTETTSLQFEWDNLNLTELLVCAVEDFKVMAEENLISVSLKVPTEPAWVQGDKKRLRQLLFILGDNACRYSKMQGQIVVGLSVDAREACFSITDQGIGIPAQDLDRVFDRHFRSQNALQSRNDGRGLGLAMAKTILKAHGGHISVTSIENSGSTFTVKLPLIFQEEDHSCEHKTTNLHSTI